jgi:hypothetical protein
VKEERKEGGDLPSCCLPLGGEVGGSRKDELRPGRVVVVVMPDVGDLDKETVRRRRNDDVATTGGRSGTKSGEDTARAFFFKEDKGGTLLLLPAPLLPPLTSASSLSDLSDLSSSLAVVAGWVHTVSVVPFGNSILTNRDGCRSDVGGRC